MGLGGALATDALLEAVSWVLHGDIDTVNRPGPRRVPTAPAFAGYAITVWLSGRAKNFTVQLAAAAQQPGGAGRRLFQLPNSDTSFASVEALVAAYMVTPTGAGPFGTPLVVLRQFQFH